MRAKSTAPLVQRGFLSSHSRGLGGRVRDERTEGRRSPVLATVAVALVLLACWQGWAVLAGYPSYIMPRPLEVLRKAVAVVSNGSLWLHVVTTAGEVLVGLGLGVTAAVVVGYALGTWDWAERVLSPYIVAAQSVPVVALAPLLVIWFGFGLTSKVLVCAMIVFFPMMVSTIVGLRSVPPELMELMATLHADRWQVFTKLQIPAALPVLFGGLRLSVTLSVVGAVVGEFVGADRGLGFLVSLGRGLYDTPLMFVALGALMVMAMAMYLGVLAMEKRLLRWRY